MDGPTSQDRWLKRLCESSFRHMDETPKEKISSWRESHFESKTTPGGSSSTLSWFRQPPGAPSANAVLAHLARLRVVRALDLPADLGRDIHQNRLLRASA